MAEAEYLLAIQRRNNESVLPVSNNGEERVPSPLPPEQLAKAPSSSSSTSMDQGRMLSPPSKNEHYLTKTPSKVYKKKKKCLSDIFGHIVSGTMESSTGLNVTDQLCATTWSPAKEVHKSSPYADLDSVPLLNRSKRTSVTPVKDVVGMEQGSTKTQTKFTEKSNHCTAPRESMSTYNSNSTVTNSEQSLVSCDEQSRGSPKKHSTNLPASSRLMTRALRAEEETDLQDALATSQTSTNACSDNCPKNIPANEAFTTEISPNWDHRGNTSSLTSHSSPKRRLRKPHKKLLCNGSLFKPQCTDRAETPVATVEVKTENIIVNISSSSSPSSSSLSPLDTFQDVKELTFKSLANEDSSDSELASFRPKSNYKFSTFLMLLKDMHDTREKDGKPLTIPQSANLIKEEPLVIPAAADSDLLQGAFDSFTPGFKTENGKFGNCKSPYNVAVKTKNRTRAIMSSDTYHCGNVPIHPKMRNLDKQRRKQKLPAKLRSSVSGLSSDLADFAYGREFVSGHADLAGTGSGPLVPADLSAGYLIKNLESAVAPKKRWQVLEEVERNKADLMNEASAKLNGCHSVRASAGDLDTRPAANDLHSLESSSTAGKTQVVHTTYVFKHRQPISVS